MNPLPKSVKVRSTCNACQQAKIRCSHEKPSCRRCQKQNIACIYSMSRRLGRPAKKRDPEQGRHSNYRESPVTHRSQRTRKGRANRKQVKDESSPEKSPETAGLLLNTERMFLDQSTLDEIVPEGISRDGTLQPASFLNGEKDYPFSAPDAFDLSSDSWLHEFISCQPNELPHDGNVLDMFSISNSNIDNIFIPSVVAATQDTSNCTRVLPVCPSNMPEQIPPGSYYASRESYQMNHEATLASSGDMCEIPPPYYESLRRDAMPFGQSLPLAMEHFQGKPAANDTPHVPRIGDYEISDNLERLKPEKNQLVPPHYQCQCHEQTVRELIRVNMGAYRPGSAVTIDSILSTQKLVQQLADTILQCCVCSKLGVNLLMVVVVSIDSLVTAIEAVVCMENGLADGLCAELQDHYIYDRPSEMVTGGKSLPHRDMACHLKAQVESCPLIVGGFRVPGDDKFSFILQVLHGRLSGLLNTIRRIRACAQDVLDIPSSRGKLVMVTETDRRLQLIMMRMKMLTGVGC